MKYCPYCGADLVEVGVSFCVECGKQLPAGKTQKEKPEDKQEIKKATKKKNSAKKPESCIEVQRSWMMDMMDIMTISIRLTKDMSVKA